jgi:hypothetical protein
MRSARLRECSTRARWPPSTEEVSSPRAVEALSLWKYGESFLRGEPFRRSTQAPTSSRSSAGLRTERPAARRPTPPGP